MELIKAEIARRAKEESERLLSEAQRRAQEILAEARERGSRALEDRVRPEIRVLRGRIVGSALLEGRSLLLKAKEEAVDEVFKLAEEELRRIVAGEREAYDYDAILFNLIKEAVDGLGEDRALLILNERDAERLRGRLKELERRLSSELGRNVSIELAKERVDCMGGVIARSPDGSKTFYNTLEGRLLRVRDELRYKLHECLFGTR